MFPGFRRMRRRIPLAVCFLRIGFWRLVGHNCSTRRRILLAILCDLLNLIRRMCDVTGSLTTNTHSSATSTMYMLMLSPNNSSPGSTTQSCQAHTAAPIKREYKQDLDEMTSSAPCPIHAQARKGKLLLLHSKLIHSPKQGTLAWPLKLLSVLSQNCLSTLSPTTATALV